MTGYRRLETGDLLLRDVQGTNNNFRDLLLLLRPLWNNTLLGVSGFT